MKLSSLILVLTSTISLNIHATELKTQSQLFLVGGGLKSCSSMAKKNCNSNALSKINQLDNIKHNNEYKINQETIDLLTKQWPKDANSTTKKQLIRLLKRSINNKNVTLKELKSIFSRTDKKEIIRHLTSPEYYALLDILEQPVLNTKTNKRIKEHVELLQSTNVFSTSIYQKFVLQAKVNSNNGKPNIVVITASSRDPFSSVDFYLAAFEQAGANTKWLPLDATLNELMQRSGDKTEVCQDLTNTRALVQGSVNREAIYPDLTSQQMQACLTPKIITNAIKNADGLFINGGDQSLTLKAFINHDGSDNEILKIIKKKLKGDNFVVGGTSAGTAVMSGGIFDDSSIAMITNGQSNTAIVRGAKKDTLPTEGCQDSASCDQNLLSDDLTFNSHGGLGLFHWGITDTHFSERGRQGRLAKLALDTGARLAFGVDESTALITSNLLDKSPSFDVIGQGGVFIIENNIKKPATQYTGTNSVKIHYISYGDTAQMIDNKLTIDIANWKNTPLETVNIPENTTQLFSRDRFKKMTEILCRSKTSSFNAVDEWKDSSIEVRITKLPDSVSGYGAIQAGEIVKDYCSYKNYEFYFTSKLL